MKTERRTADELGLGALVIYTGALYYIGSEYLDEDDGSVTAVRLVPILSSGRPILCDLTRNPGYLFKHVAHPVFAVEPCGSEDDEIMAVAFYDATYRGPIAIWAEGEFTPSSDLLLGSGDIAHYGDFIGLIDTGEGFEYRVVGKERLSKHYVLNFTEGG